MKTGFDLYAPEPPQAVSNRLARVRRASTALRPENEPSTQRGVRRKNNFFPRRKMERGRRLPIFVSENAFLKIALPVARGWHRNSVPADPGGAVRTSLNPHPA